jgi:hypothetical protein
MSANVSKTLSLSIHRDIQNHSAWYGNIPGLTADKMLRGRKTPYLYILRAGEEVSDAETNYYVSFILPDLSIRHQPFTITVTADGWYYENTGGGGPYVQESIEDVLHLMMHAQKEDCLPLKKLHVR